MKPAWATKGAPRETKRAVSATKRRETATPHQTPKAVTKATETKPLATVTPPAPRPQRRAPKSQGNAVAQASPMALRVPARDADAPPPKKWEAAYLAALSINGGQKVGAAKAARVDFSTVFRHRESCARFETIERDALKSAFDVAESEAVRRAVHGVVSVYTTKDGKKHKETRYSDTILLRLLEKRQTGSWCQKQQIEHSGGMTFKTRAERKEALEKARAAEKQQPVAALNGRS